MSLENAPRQKAFGKELYPTIFSKAALYARDIIMNHPFLDGNKRTGIVAASVFLENNGYRFVGNEGEVERFALNIIRNKLEVDIIAGWFKKHSQRTQK